MKQSVDAIVQREQALYLESLLPERDAVAQSLEGDADTHGVPIVDPEVGRFLRIAAMSIGARRILEVGTATGYSGLHFLQALPIGGELVTIDISAERQQLAREHWERAGVQASATTRLGPALEVIPTLEGPFDLLFLDAIKSEYSRYLDLALPLVRTGGLIIADNVLMGGRVAAGERDDDIDALRAFNAYTMEHPALLSVILPLGDGLLYAVKTAE
jgi:caffeoyl-CoA O-methyltransferase